MTFGFLIGFFLTIVLILLRPVLNPIFFPYVVKIGLVGSNTLTTVPLSIQKNISVGLTSLDKDGTAKPSLATHWIATDSGKRYVFYLRNNAYWHDGTKVEAGDISYRLKDASISAIDDTTLQVDVKDEFSPLTTVFSRPVFKDTFVGLGLYKIGSIKYKGEIIAVLELLPTKKDFPKLIYKFYPSLDEAILAFKMGEIDKLEDIPSKDSFSNWPNVKIKEKTQFDRFLGIFFNTQKEEFKDKETRQAFSFATPYFSGFERLYTPISSSSWAYFDKVRIYKFDLDHAKNILKDTALATSSAQITISTYPVYLAFAQKVADSWNDLGINTKVKIERTLPSDYQALLIAQEIPADPDQYQYWHSNAQNTNLSHYASQKIDKLLEDGRKTIDVDERKKIYQDFQRYLVDDAPVVFLFFPKVYTIERQ